MRAAPRAGNFSRFASLCDRPLHRADSRELQHAGSSMNFHLIALSGAALFALTISAAAQESGGSTSGGATSSAPATPEPPTPQPTYSPPPAPPPAAEMYSGGWYLGLGAGWSSLNNTNFSDSLGNSGTVNSNDGILAVGSLGYKFPAWPLRVELEGGYDWHSLSGIDVDGASVSASGHANLGDALVNAVYDIPIAPRWAISVGAGAGAAFTDLSGTTPDLTISRSKTRFMWQGIGGLAYSVGPNTDLFVDYHYRDAMTSGSYETVGADIVHVHNTTENAVIAGVRWYLTP
jgi:opacity protein-like surface antigen